jgi:hypothetical protein
MVGVLFGLGSLLAFWATLIWLPTILSLMTQKSGPANANAAAPFRLMFLLDTNVLSAMMSTQPVPEVAAWIGAAS